MEASRINPDNSAAKEALAVALYASGDFERALIQFHRVYRLGLFLKASLMTNVFCSECEALRGFSRGLIDARRR